MRSEWNTASSQWSHLQFGIYREHVPVRFILISAAFQAWRGLHKILSSSKAAWVADKRFHQLLSDPNFTWEPRHSGCLVLFLREALRQLRHILFFPSSQFLVGHSFPPTLEKDLQKLEVEVHGGSVFKSGGGLCRGCTVPCACAGWGLWAASSDIFPWCCRWRHNLKYSELASSSNAPLFPFTILSHGSSRL